MSQTISKSSMLGIIFGLGIVIAFIVVVLMLGQNNVAELPKPADIAKQSGKIIYDKTCVTCHTTGVLNAPKLGNKTDWEQRVIKGEAVLLQNAINGFNIMPPRGGAYLNDEDMKQALQYMLSSIEFVTDPKISLENLEPSQPVKVTTPVITPISQPLKVVSQSPASGKSVYDKVCMACHNTGLLNAPKIGDKTDWAARIEKGETTLIQNSINGFNAMPPRGGSYFNDADMQSAVQYMLASVGIETSKIPETAKVAEPTPNLVKPTEPKASEPIITKPKIVPKEIPATIPKVSEIPKEVPKAIVIPKVSEIPKEVPKAIVIPKVSEIPKEVPKAIVTPKVSEVPKEVVTTSEPVASAPTSPKQGKDIYDITCKSCHIVGIAGAPRVAEKKDWEQRLPKGEDILVQNAINGFNIMPPKGGNSNLTDEEVKLAVQYMLKIIKIR